MPTPPTGYQTLSRADLNDKFQVEGWAARFDAWIRVPAGDYTWAIGRQPPRVREVRNRYRDVDGNTRAFVIDYTNDDGTHVRAVRMLRDDDGVQWDVLV